MSQLGDLLRTGLFMLVFYPLSIPWVVWAGTVGLLSTRQLHWASRGWTTLHRNCAANILKIKLVEENRPPDQPVLYVFKHESFFEAIDLPRAFDRPMIFAKAELMRIPFWGKAALRFGLVPVERDQGAKALRAMLAGARQGVAQGRVLVLFPEGRRVAHGSRPALQSGFAGLYKLLGLPVIPVAVNSGPLYRGAIKHRGQITYRYGEMLPPGLPRAEIEAKVIAAINALGSGLID